MKNYDFDKQHRKGKLHAYERIQMLMDKDTFVETYEVQNVEAGQAGSQSYSGVITGYGNIRGKKVYVYSQDFTVYGGTLGWNQGFKISRTIEDAIRNKCPVIGINDSGGARIQEGIDAMAGYGEVFYYNTMASGYIPQIAIVAGPCAGGAVYSPAIMDFTFIVENIGKMFLTGPKVVKKATGKDISAEELGGSRMHTKYSGVAAFKCESELDCYNKVRDLIDLLPSCYAKRKLGSFEYAWASDDKDQSQIVNILPEADNKVYNVKDILRIILDDNSFLEVYADFAKSVVTAFGKLGNNTVGIVANQPKYRAGVLDCDASDKAARFIRYCDNYNIPVITFVDVPGFMPGKEEEEKGIIRHGAKMLYAYAEATTPKITVLMRKAYGGAYVAMNSRHLRADRVYAWPSAQIAIMAVDSAVEIIYNKEVATISDEGNKQAFIESKKEEYRRTAMGIKLAQQRGFVDAIIDPATTRKTLINDIHVLLGKSRVRKNAIQKKHGNIPL